MTKPEAYNGLTKEQCALLAIIDKSCNVIFTNRQRRALALRLSELYEVKSVSGIDNSNPKVAQLVERLQ